MSINLFPQRILLKVARLNKKKNLADAKNAKQEETWDPTRTIRRGQAKKYTKILSDEGNIYFFLIIIFMTVRKLQLLPQICPFFYEVVVNMSILSRAYKNTHILIKCNFVSNTLQNYKSLRLIMPLT